MRHQPQNSRLFLDRAREMRQAPNDAEAAIWNALRDRRLRGFKFRRQQPLGNYIADFYCVDAKLVVELDGKAHANTKEYDAERDAWLQSQGILVIRFSNEDVRKNLEALLESVWQKCVERSSQDHSQPSPSP